MRRVWFAMLFCLFNYSSFAQGSFGLGIGLGYTTAAKSRITPAFEAYHLWKLSPHWYAGAQVSLQRYAFLYESGIAPYAVGYGDLISIRQKSSFLFFTPRIDYGIGYRKYMHISLLGGPGAGVSAGQTTHRYEPLLTTSTGSSGADTVAFNTSYNVPRLIFKIGLSVTERIPTHGYFNITLTQEFCNLMNKLNYNGPPLTTSYFCFTVGLVHKYPQVWRELD